MQNIGLNEVSGAAGVIKLNGARGAATNGAIIAPLKVAAVAAFVAGLGSFQKARVSCAALVRSAVEAGATRVELVEAGEKAGFNREWVSQVVRTEAGLRERGERSDKGKSKSPVAHRVFQAAMRLAKGDARKAGCVLQAAYKLAVKAMKAGATE